VLGNLPEILGKKAPDTLEHEVAKHVRSGRSTLLELVVEISDVDDRVSGERRLATKEDRLASSKKEKGVILVREVDEVENHPRLSWKRPWLPDLQSAERADNNKPGRRNATLRVGCLPPVVECLIPMLLEPRRLRRRLHLDDADPRPDEVEKLTSLMMLEVSDVASALPVALEKSVEERLCLTPFAALVHAPSRGERRESAANFLAGEGHALESQLLSRDSEVRRLHQPTMEVGKVALRVLEGVNKVRFGLILTDGLGGSLCTLASV